MPSTLDLCIFACELAGLLMVAGALWLLKVGIIKLSESVKGASGLSVELHQKIKEVEKKLKISTSFPTVALFIIGFGFIASGLYFAKSSTQSFRIKGKLPIPDATAATLIVTSSSLNLTPDSNGELDRFVEFDPRIRRLMVILNVAGYSPPQTVFTLNVEDAKGQSLTLPTNLKFTKLDARPAAPGEIVSIPANIQLAPLTADASY